MPIFRLILLPRVWVIIFAFVGIQLAWNLRPFVGYKSMAFELLRNNTQGNFYSSMIKSLGEMIGTPNIQNPVEPSQNDSTENPKNDPPKQPEETVKKILPPEPAEPTQNDSQKKD